MYISSPLPFSRLHVVGGRLVEPEPPAPARARVDFDLHDAAEPVGRALLRTHAGQVAAVRAGALQGGRARAEGGRRRGARNLYACQR